MKGARESSSSTLFSERLCITSSAALMPDAVGSPAVVGDVALRGIKVLRKFHHPFRAICPRSSRARRGAV
jgi:hypothetical protein